MKDMIKLAAGALVGAAILFSAGCSTAPKDEIDRQSLVDRSASTRDWFEARVSGLHEQINNSAGYIVFPDVGSAGFIIGGTSGRGVLFDNKGNQLGWSRLSSGSIGLQAGVRGFRMLMVLEDQTTLDQFRANKWNGSVGAVAVAGNASGTAASAFQRGVAIYEGASSGLMAGLDIGLNNITFQPINSDLKD